MNKLWKSSSRRERLYLALILTVALLILSAVLLRPRNEPAEPTVSASAVAEEPRVIIKEVEKLVTVEKEIKAETIRDGLRDMGFLITAEYYFTDLISFSSVKKFLKTDIVLPFTETSYLVSYDGVVSAGIDLSAATVEKDDGQKRVSVHIPAASIHATTIDHDSFTLYEEKSGLGNPLSAADFNNSLRELERSAEQKAGERGILEQAESNARAVIENFVRSLLSDYTVTVETT